MPYLSIRTWKDHQHYKDRRPPWVKLYVKVLEDETFGSWDVPTRLLSLLLLPLAANRDNRIPDNPVWIGVECGMSSKSVAKSLATLLADSYLICTENAPSETDAETETERTSLAVGTNGLETDRELAVLRLLDSLKDKDSRTHLVVRGIVTSGKLAVGDIEWARECATGPGVNSPTRVAVAELKKRSAP